MAGDITYIKTQTGWTYLSIVMDLFNREIIGYSISKNIDTELVKGALGNAISRVNNTEGIIFHSDRGPQYRSKGYKNIIILDDKIIIYDIKNKEIFINDLDKRFKFCLNTCIDVDFIEVINDNEILLLKEYTSSQYIEIL